MADIFTKKEVTLTNKEPTVDIDQADSSQTVNYIIYFILGIIEILLAFRLILKLTGANPVTGFVSFIYSLSQIFVVPFTGIFPQTTGTGAVTTAYFEPSTIVAMIVYAVVAWGIAKIISIASRKVQD